MCEGIFVLSLWCRQCSGKETPGPESAPAVESGAAGESGSTTAADSTKNNDSNKLSSGDTSDTPAAAAPVPSKALLDAVGQINGVDIYEVFELFFYLFSVVFFLLSSVSFSTLQCLYVVKIEFMHVLLINC